MRLLIANLIQFRWPSYVLANKIVGLLPTNSSPFYSDEDSPFPLNPTTKEIKRE